MALEHSVGQVRSAPSPRRGIVAMALLGVVTGVLLRGPGTWILDLSDETADLMLASLLIGALLGGMGRWRWSAAFVAGGVLSVPATLICGAFLLLFI